jgi:hypothetical protein
MLERGLADEAMQGLCQGICHVRRATRAGALPHAWSPLGGQAMAPLTPRGIGKGERGRDGLEAVPGDDGPHGLGPPAHVGLLGVFPARVARGKRSIRQVECEGPQREGLQERRRQQCIAVHGTGLL